MKFAICNETFRDWPLEKAFDFAADCGYSGMEIAPFTLAEQANQISTGQRAEIGRLAERAGLEIVGLHWLLAKTEGLHLTSPDAEVRRKTADYLADLARLCFDLGGRVISDAGAPENYPDGGQFKHQLDISKLQSGFYLLVMTDEEDPRPAGFPSRPRGRFGIFHV